jgi:hypothetical protein
VRRRGARGRASAARGVRWLDDAWRAPLVRAAVASGVLLSMAAAGALSPLLRIRQVTWTGALQAPVDRCTHLESTVLGRPLLFVSEAALRRDFCLDKTPVDLQLQRHLPGNLEVRLVPRRAVAQLDAQTAVDAHGQVLGAEHVWPGLPVLQGFALDSKAQRLAPEARTLLAALVPLFDIPTLAPSTVAWQEPDDLRLVLADSGAEVRLDASHADSELLKLRVFEESLGSAPMPGVIDLRFQDQVVVRNGGGGRNARVRTR